MSIKKSIENITLGTVAALSIYSGMNMDAVSANKVEIAPSQPKTETLKIDDKGNISLREIATKTGRTSEIRGDNLQINYLYKTGALRLIVNPDNGKSEVLLNQAKLEQVLPKKQENLSSNMNSVKLKANHSEISGMDTSKNKNIEPSLLEKSPIIASAVLALSFATAAIWSKLNRTKRNDKITPVADAGIPNPSEDKNTVRHEPIKLNYNLIESMKKMRLEHAESIRPVQSNPIETAVNPNGAPITFASKEGDFQLGTFYNTGEPIAGIEYKNGMSLLNAGGYNNYSDGYQNDSKEVSKLLVAQVNELVDSIEKEKYEVYTLSDVVLSDKFLTLSRFYYIYSKPVISSGELTTNIVTLIAKKPGIDPAKIIKLIPSYGVESHTEMYSGVERKSQLSYSAMIVELRNLALLNSYGSFLSNIESRKKDNIAIIEAIKNLKKGVIGGGDSNNYGIDTRDGNGVGKFLPMLFRDNNWETVEYKNLYAQNGLSYLSPKKIDGGLETTFYGSDELSFEMADNLKDKLLIPIKKQLTTKGLGFSLDRVITNSDKVSVKIGSTCNDHAQVIATHEGNNPIF